MGRTPCGGRFGLSGPRAARASGWTQDEDISLSVLDGEAGKAVAGRLWVYLDDRNVVYDFTPTKQGKGPAAYLTGFNGVLLADGGSEFNEAVRALGLTRAGCWLHARRYFIDAEETSPALAAEGIGFANRLFAIERGLNGADATERALVRGTQTRQVLDEMRAWLTAKVHGLRPKSAIGRAFHYVLGQWDHLVVCAEHPEIPIHNNLSELQLRRPVIGPPDRAAKLALCRLGGRRKGRGCPLLHHRELQVAGARSLRIARRCARTDQRPSGEPHRRAYSGELGPAIGGCRGVTRAATSRRPRHARCG